MALPRVGAWVARTVDSDDAFPTVAVVKDAYVSGGEELLDLVFYSRSGDRVGRVSPACGGPKGFEPCCGAAFWQVIERPDFEALARAIDGYRHLLQPITA